MNSKHFRYGWVFILIALFVSALACNLGESAEKIEHAAQTAQAVATKGGEIATAVSGSDIVKTGEALATQMAESGIEATLQAAATQIPGQGADIKATMELVLTQNAYGEAPPDIPLAGEERKNFFGSEHLVSYTVALPFEQVLDFYRQEMPTYGWQPGEDDSVETSTFARLSYQSPSQRVMITVSDTSPENETLVLINIYEK